MNMIINAIRFATHAHAGQVRKYNGRPYIEHPIRVACRVACLDCFVQPIIMLGERSQHEIAIISALLHDTIEDCPDVTQAMIEFDFGVVVGAVVWQLTNPRREAMPGLNRAARKAQNRERIKEWGPTPRVIKLVDRIDNLRDMPERLIDVATSEAERYDNFRRLYREESHLLLQALAGTHPELEGELRSLLTA